MKKLYELPLFLFSAGLIFLCSGQTKTITATGAVKDSVTGAPLPQSMVLFYASETINIDTSNIGNLKFDTAFTDANGKFSRTMQVSQLSIILFYGALKEGYQLKYNAKGILLSTVSIGDILLAKINNTNKDTLMVTGTVVDSASGAGIEGAYVAMSGVLGLDTVGNTLFTTSGGSFSKQVIVSKTGTLHYFVIMQQYTPILSQTAVTGKQVNLGQIKMRPIVPIITGNIFPKNSKLADNISVYSLRGQLLYAGSIKPITKILKNQTSPVIINFKYNNTPLGQKKYIMQK